MRIKKSGKLLVAFFVLFGLIAAPIQMPLEGLIVASINHSDSTQYATPHESSDTAESDGEVLQKESEYTLTYTRGETAPKLALENPTETPADLVPLQEPEMVTPLIMETEELTERLQPSRVSSRSHPNIRGAELVARGENGSEITKVVLDADANVLALVDAHGEKTEATYNDTENPLTITYPDDTTVSYTYDEEGNVTGITYGKRGTEDEGDKSVLETVAQAFIQPLFALAGIGEEEGGTEIEYDDGAVAEIGNNDSSISYEYDEDGLLIREIRTDGSYIEYSYDELGNIVEKMEVEAETDASFSFTSFLKRTIAGIIPVSYTESVEYNDDNQLVRFQIDRDTVSYEESTSTEPAAEIQEAPKPTDTQVTETPSVEEVGEVSSEAPAVDETVPEVQIEQMPNQAVEPETEEATQTEHEDTGVISWLYRVGTEVYDRIASLFSFTYADEITEADVVAEDSASTPPAEPQESVMETPALQAGTEQVLPVLETNDTENGVGNSESVAPVTHEEVVESVTATPSVTDSTTSIEEVSTTPETPIESNTPAFLDLAFSYDAQGNMIARRSPTGLGFTYSYDKETDARDGISVQTSAGTILERTYAVDDKTARIVGSDGVRFTYDDTGALTRAGDTRYTYDDRGNRLSAATGDSDIAYRYDSNRLEIVSYPNGRITSYTYNERGQVTTVTDTEKGNTSLTYNETGAIASLENATEHVTYAYDAVGRRTSRTSSLTGTLAYTYTGPQLTKVEGNDGEVLREYFYTPKGELVAVVMGDALYHVVTDQSKSIIGLVNDKTGELLYQSYDIWGTVTESSIGGILDIGYVGTFAEPTFGFSILGPRVYDPEIGRFLSKDPLPGFIIDTLSQNEYLYAKNDPVNHFDPSGHQSELADTSSSPVRALVETNLLIESLESELDSTKAVVREMEALMQEDPDDPESASQLEGSRQSVAAIESALEVLRTMKKKQEDEIAANEAQAMVSFSLPTPTDPDTSLTAPVNITVPTVETVPVTTPTTGVESDEGDEDSDDDESLSVAGGAVLAFTNFIDDHVLKAEAKKKKSDKKKKKKSKKSKKKSSKKAKEAQKKKAEQTAKMSALLSKLSKILGDLKVVVDKRVAEEKRIAQKRAEELKRLKEEEEQRKLAEIQRKKNEIENLKQQLALQKEIERLNDKLQAIKAAEEKQKADEAARAQAAQNANALAVNNTDSLQTTPVTYGYVSPFASENVPFTTAIGMGTYNSTPIQNQSNDYKAMLTEDNAHIALTACGFEPTIAGAACGVADGILYLFTGKWGDASLSVISSVPIVGATADGAKAAKLALKAAEEARLASLLQTVGFSVRAGEVMAKPERFVELSILKKAIMSGNSLPDTQGSTALMYYSKELINGKYYNLEVLYDIASNKIWHFKYTSEAIGNLPAI